MYFLLDPEATPRLALLEASASYRRPPPREDPCALGRLERTDGAADGRHGRHVTPTDGSRARQLKGRDSGGLHHDHVARRRRFFATWALRQCCATPTTAAARRSWSQHHRTHGRHCCGRGSCRLEEAGVAAIAARRVSQKRLCQSKAARACSILRAGADCLGAAIGSGHGTTRTRQARAVNSGGTDRAGLAMLPGFSVSRTLLMLSDGNAYCSACARPGCT